MIFNTFRIGLRNLTKRKFFTFINVVGLAVGMSACLFILLYIRNELSYDRFHDKADHIHRLVKDIKTATGVEKGTKTSVMMGPELKKEYPGVQQYVRLREIGLLLDYNGVRFQEQEVLMADPSVFEVFDFPLRQGDPRTALGEPNTVVLTESAARKYFGQQDPIGKTIKADVTYTLKVTGVMADVPETSHLDFNMLVSMSSFKDIFESENTNWYTSGVYTYLLLPEGYDPASIQGKLPDFTERHMGKGMRWLKVAYNFSLEPLTRIYLHSERTSPKIKSGNYRSLYVFSVIALFILLLACINFINLATARSVERAQEVGIRKVMGAERPQLTLQFLGESVATSLLAFVLAVLLCETLLPLFNTLSGKTIQLSALEHGLLALTLLVLALVVGVLAGLYPATVLSSFKPIVTLKGNFRASAKGTWIRQGLVIVQFTISIALIASTAIVYSQLSYMRQRPLGFNKEQLLYVDFWGVEDVRRNYRIVTQAMRREPGVLGVSFTASLPGLRYPEMHTAIETRTGEIQETEAATYLVDFGFLPTMGMELAAGRDFSAKYATDSTSALLLNETAARNLGYTNPAEAIGKKFKQSGYTGTVIGVVKNFNFHSLRSEVTPLTLRIRPEESSMVVIRLKPGEIQGTVKKLEALWNRYLPTYPFNYEFMDESFDRQYKLEEQFGRVFTVFSSLAILMACLGLFALATYSTQQRLKEIGIRKVLGASVAGIVLLIAKDFAKLVALAFVIATPISWFLMHKWLNNFAYRIDIGIEIYLLTGLVTVIIAWFSISYQAIKSALVNPVRSIRS